MDRWIGGILTGYAYVGSTRVAEVTTVTEDSISISSDVAELRTGQGNGLRGKMYHTSKFSLKITESLFRFEWLAMLVGREFIMGADIFKTEDITVDATGKGKVSFKPVAFGNEGLIAFVDEPSTGKSTTVTLGADGTFTDITLANKVVCVTYKYTHKSATKLVIPVNMIPKEMRLELKGDVFNGDGRENRTKVAEIFVTVPRYQLNASVELSLTNTGVMTMPLEGEALSVKDYSVCNGSEYFAVMAEVDYDKNWYDEAKSIAATPREVELGVGETESLTTIAVFNGLFANAQVDAEDLTFTSDTVATATVDADGKITAVATGTTNVTVKVTGKPELTSTVAVTVA